MSFTHNKKLLFFLLAIMLNGLVSFLVTLKHQPINVDGILYLKSAKIYLESGVIAAAKVYPWPFYSILIALLSTLFHCSLLQSAMLLNIFFSSFLVAYFLLLLETFAGTAQNQYWGLCVILLCPFLNHERINALKDIGYYTFFLISLYYLARFMQRDSTKTALGWQISIISATLFRIEGLFLYIFAPLLARKNIFKLWSIGILFLVLALLCCKNLLHFGRLSEVLYYFKLPDYVTEYQVKLAQQRQLLDPFGQNSAAPYLIGGLIGIAFFALIKSLGLLSMIVVIYCVFNRHKLHLNSYAVQLTFKYGIIVMAVLGAFTLRQFFLSERYVFPLALLFLLFVPFGLRLMWQEKKILYRTFVVIFILTSISSSFVQFGTSKSYLIEAGTWIAEHTQKTATLYSNDPLIVFYANRTGTDYPKDFQNNDWQTVIRSPNLMQYDYAAILLKHKQSEKISLNSKFILLKTFSNNKQDEILIYAIHNQSLGNKSYAPSSV